MADFTVTLGRLAVSATRQAGGAPLIDMATTTEPSGHRRCWRSVAVVPPWRLRRPRWRTGKPTRALVVGWEVNRG